MQRVLIVVSAVVYAAFSGSQPGGSGCIAGEPSKDGRLRILERVPSESTPPIYMAYYTQPTGLEMIGPIGVTGLSEDGGRTWKPFRAKPNFSADLPHGYRRDYSYPSAVDPKSGRLVKVYNALDTPDLDPKIHEPPIALKQYYVRYQVSTDAGRTYLFDEPVVQQGHTPDNPFDGVTIGENGIYFGDRGSVPIFNRRGELLVPLNPCLADENGDLANPGGGFTYHDVLVIIGTWDKDDRMTWEISERVRGNPKLTTRGLCEPTLAEMPDGRILMIMRGSNGGKKDPQFKMRSYKWMSVSDDGGRTWSKPKPWTCDNGRPFYSPASMSQLLTHSSGRVFWVGNISPTNTQANSPRWPLVIGEVDNKTLRLIESSMLTVDTHRPDDPPQVPGSKAGRLDISHVWTIEDRQTSDILLTFPRATDGYKHRTWASYRIGVQ